jgi:hypothetical protein
MLVVVVLLDAWIIWGDERLETDNSPDTTSSMPGIALIELTISVAKLLLMALVRAV